MGKKALQKTVLARLPDDLEKPFSLAISRTGQSKNQLVEDALRYYLGCVRDDGAEFRRAVVQQSIKAEFFGGKPIGN